MKKNLTNNELDELDYLRDIHRILVDNMDLLGEPCDCGCPNKWKYHNHTTAALGNILERLKEVYIDENSEYPTWE